MRLNSFFALSLSLGAIALAGCGETKTSSCMIDLKDSALFGAELAADAPAEVAAAMTAARSLEAVSAQQRAFDEKIAVIAKDPKLSEQWVKTLKVSGEGARTAAQEKRLAVDLPQQAIRLRAAGVSNEEVIKLIDAGKKVNMPSNELAGLVHVTAASIEENGAVDELTPWLTERITLGIRGDALEKEVRNEHKARGAKIEKAELAAGKKAVVCHKPPGNPANQKTLEVGASAVKAHLAHGDSEGPCGTPDAAKDTGKDKDKDKDTGKPEDKSKDTGKGADKGNQPTDPGKPADPGKPGAPGKGKAKGM